MTQPSPEYTAQLQQKAGYLKQRFAEFSPPEWQVFASPEKHYRMRAEFRVWHVRARAEGGFGLVAPD